LGLTRRTQAINLANLQVGRDLRITFYDGPAYPRRDYRTEVERFLSFHRSRFIAREDEVKELEDFCLRREPGYFLVEALGGFGKTTLLARLIDRLERGSRNAASGCVLYMIRSGGARNTTQSYLQAVNAQLLDVLGLRGGTPPDLDQLSSQFSELWQLACNTAQSVRTPLLLVVDGLDDMAGETTTIASVLPSQLADWVHVIVSSRPKPAAREMVDPEHPLRTADALHLERFEAGSASLVLGHYGVPEDQAKTLAPRVIALTKGEPLFVRFVCEEVGEEGESALARMEKDPPADVEDYFRRQLHQLDGMSLGDISWDLLGLLTVARRGLTPHEMAEALGNPLRKVKTALKPLERYLLPGEAREVFHRAFRDLVASEFMEEELSKYRGQLIDWCKGYQTREWPPTTPAYALSEFGGHLFDWEDHEALTALCDRHWFRRQREATGSLSGFIRDAELALRALASADRVGDEIHLCLLIATIASVATNSPPPAIAVLARLGRFQEAYGYAETALPEGRPSAFIEIAKAHIEAADELAARQALDRAISALVEVEADPSDFELLADAAATVRYTEGLEAMHALALQVSDPLGQASLLLPVLRAFAAVGEIDRARELAQQPLKLLHEAPTTIQLRAALAEVTGSRIALGPYEDSAHDVSNPAERTRQLATVAQAAAQLGDHATARRLADETVELLSDLPDGSYSAAALQAVEELSDPLFGAQRGAVVRRIFEEGRRTGDFGLLVYYPAAIEDLAAVIKPEGVTEAAAALGPAEGRETSLTVLAELSALLGRLDEAVALVERIPLGDGSFRDAAISSVVTHLSHRGLLEDAESLAGEAPGSNARAIALGEVAWHLLESDATERAESVARRAIREGERLEDYPTKATALAAISRTFKDLGEQAKAEAAADDAYRTLMNKPPGGRTPEAVGNLTQALLGVGRVDDARALAIEADAWQGAVGGRGLSPLQSHVLADVASAYVAIKRPDAARELAELAARVASSERDYHRARSEMAAIRAFQALGEAKRAGTILERIQAVVAAAPAESDLGRPASVAQVAKALRRQGREADAVQLARTAASRLQEHEWDDVEVAEALAEAGLSDAASRLATKAVERILREGPFLELDVLSVTRAAALLPSGERVKALLHLKKGASERDMPWRAITLSIVAAELHRLGHAESVPCAREAFRLSRQALRWAFLSVLAEDAEIVAGLDNGETLGRVHQALLDIDQWWNTEPEMRERR
jgi:nucleoside-triphosphatase THEP1